MPLDSNCIRQADTAGARLSATAERAQSLLDRVRDLPTEEALGLLIREEFKGEIALVSSFGAESAVLLHMVAQIDPATPVVFLDTGKLFGETRRYKKKLVELLGLTEVRTILPDEERLKQEDPKGILWNGNANMCCWVRKVEPMQRALDGLTAWISGRKRFQADTRSALEIVEAEGSQIKINPLAYWTAEDIEDYFTRYDLPRHPLVADGYLSIGCMPCTAPVEDGQDARSGRWKGQGKVECGIHFSNTGTPERSSLTEQTN
ncbi:phosphoadenylyl-sulfate reductase [Kiloniella sp. b19]|uniref:phosphoadenylyl-sulfate reductase n=1 Tax=Kiloniella sp. GXU_MW_B19 TaxID=3141326 RepID=UPI0031D96C76